MIARHPQVERIACGHLHRSIERRFAGTIAGTAPSTAHQVRLDLRPGARLHFRFEPPGYQLHLWDEGGLVTHTAVLGDFRPLEAAVEQTFVNKDGVATLKLGQARGVAMLAPAMFGVSVSEYAPNQVKKTVVGAGHADKNQIMVMLKVLLPKAELKSADAADALAIAITHAHHRSSAAMRLKVAGL